MELLISMGASVIVIGALLMSSLSMQRALQSSETYAGAYSDQRRITDYLSRDLRRAIGVSFTDAAGLRGTVDSASTAVAISERASLILSLPGYYRSNARSEAEYADALDVVATDERLDYGTTGSLSPSVEVTFRKIYFAKENCICFLRQEAGVDEVIVRRADNLSVQVTIAPGAQSGSIATRFHSTGIGPAPVVSTFDRLLLRNPPLDFRP